MQAAKDEGCTVVRASSGSGYEQRDAATNATLALTAAMLVLQVADSSTVHRVARRVRDMFGNKVDVDIQDESSDGRGE
jgi:hypothetical protein